MSEYTIVGGQKLSGALTVPGAKNAALPIIAAALLNNSQTVLHNCPQIADTVLSAQILQSLGCTVKFEGSTLIINSKPAREWSPPEKLTAQMRSSILFMGAMLGRFGKAICSEPGGCKLGPRPINLHLNAFRQMGIGIKEGEKLYARVSSLQGARIALPFPSVGATENIMLAAVLANGETVIQGAAKEPEIVDLQDFLNSMGAQIIGAGSEVIVINGVKKLHETEHTIMPDRIAAGTFLAAAAITGGELHLKNAVFNDIISAISVLKKMGCRIKELPGGLSLKAPKRLRAVSKIITRPHPGFPTDLQAPFTALLTLAEGTSMVEENLFSSRQGHIEGLTKMGAQIAIMQEGRKFAIRGVNSLRGQKVEATDLRCGAALILAALAAEGESVVLGSQYVERGYENIEAALSKLGANIKLK